MLSKMSKIQLEITLHTKIQEKHNFNERRQSNNADTEVNQMLEISDKNFKAAVIKMLQE